MTSRRDNIRMTSGEIALYLAEQRRITVATIGPDGMPHPVPMNYGVDELGRIVITTFRKSQKVVNLQRDPRATLLVESGETYHELKSVIVYAQAEIVLDPQRVAENMALIRSSELLSVPKGSSMEHQVRSSMQKRAVILFTPLKFVSWDHSKLGSHY